MPQEFLQIPFRLVNITTDEFASIESNFDADDTSEVDISLAVRFGLSKDQHTIGVFTKYTFEQDSRTILVFECGCHFSLDEAYWHAQKQGYILTLPEGLLTHLIVLTVGTSRGVLHARKPKWFKAILPTINVSSIVTNDENFDLSQTEEEE